MPRAVWLSLMTHGLSHALLRLVLVRTVCRQQVAANQARARVISRLEVAAGAISAGAYHVPRAGGGLCFRLDQRTMAGPVDSASLSLRAVTSVEIKLFQRCVICCCCRRSVYPVTVCTGRPSDRSAGFQGPVDVCRFIIDSSECLDPFEQLMASVLTNLRLFEGKGKS